VSSGGVEEGSVSRRRRRGGAGGIDHGEQGGVSDRLGREGDDARGLANSRNRSSVCAVTTMVGMQMPLRLKCSSSSRPLISGFCKSRIKHSGGRPGSAGLTTVGQAGSPLGMPDEAPTIATVLKSMGYATGQFGKNHLGDRNQFLPTVHGFDEFYRYLYHLDAMEDPCHRNYPPALKATVGPRNMVHSWATSVDDPTEQPRWGKIGKQKIEDVGELCPKRMETVDDEILANALKFLDKARQDNKAFFLSLNPTRMHVVTHLSEKYENMREVPEG
jgi:sulfatase-like protein